MSYATLDQLRDRYGEALLVGLTDRGVNALGAIDQAVIDRALADTDAVIDARISGRYKIDAVRAALPPILVDIALCIAIWKLHRHEPSPKIKDDYADAIRQLAALADGSARLPLPDGDEPAGSGSTGARVTDRERPLTEQTLKGYI